MGIGDAGAGKNLIFVPCVLRTLLPICVRPWLVDMRPLPPIFPLKSQKTENFILRYVLRTQREVFLRHFNAPCVLMTQIVP